MFVSCCHSFFEVSLHLVSYSSGKNIMYATFNFLVLCLKGMARKGVRKRLTKRKLKLVQQLVKLPSTSRVYLKRLQWSNQQMLAVMKAVESGGAINQAAREHGVPGSTLKDQLSGKVQHGKKTGLQSYLTNLEERELGVFLKECAGIGYGKTRRDVMQISQCVEEEKSLLRSHV